MRTETFLRPIAVVLLLGLFVAPSARAQLTPQRAEIIDQESLFFPGVSHDGDLLGRSLAVGDFDGDGVDDLAVGISRERVSGQDNAGRIIVIPGSENGPRLEEAQVWTGLGLVGSAAEGDRVGRETAAGDFDGNGYADLAVGISHREVFFDGTTRNDAGVVVVLYSAAGGLGAAGISTLHQGAAGIEEMPEISDRFGDHLQVGDFNGDGHDDLAVGAFGEDREVDGQVVEGAGVVHVIYGSPTGLRGDANAVVDDLLLTKESIGGEPIENEQFGSDFAAGDFGRAPGTVSPADDLVVGSSGESVAGALGAGAVRVVYGTPTGGISVATAQTFVQSDLGGSHVSELGDGFGGALVAGDFDGDGTDDLAVGAPGEDVSIGVVSLDDLGVVNVLFGHPTQRLTATDAAAVSRFGVAGFFIEDGRFGDHLTAGDFDGDGRDDLVIAGADTPVGGLDDVGLVHVTSGRAQRTFGPSLTLGQGALGPGIADEGDSFGDEVAVGDLDGDGFTDLLVGTPFDLATNGASNGGSVSVFRSATIHSDGFESGNLAAWSQVID